MCDWRGCVPSRAGVREGRGDSGGGGSFGRVYLTGHRRPVCLRAPDYQPTTDNVTGRDSDEPRLPTAPMARTRTNTHTEKLIVLVCLLCQISLFFHSVSKTIKLPSHNETIDAVNQSCDISGFNFSARAVQDEIIITLNICISQCEKLSPVNTSLLVALLYKFFFSLKSQTFI